MLCLDKHSTGDGVISALQVLHALRDSGSSLAQLAADLSLYPQVMINVPIAHKIDLSAAELVNKAEQEAVAELGNEGRIVLRPSGTEPLIRVMVESPSEPRSRKWAEHIAAAVVAATD